MDKTKVKRLLALAGVAVILILFILTIVFLIAGNSALAITFVAINGFVTIILYFTLRFHQNTKDANEFLTQDENSGNDE